MPRKVRQLLSELRQHGFEERGGKGSHRNFFHQKGIRITISGSPGSDAKVYQIRAVQEAIEQSRK
ncbi:MAG: type II toxin-antitoxin system HicA family toxin [Verrucomicrobiota bacterium]